MENRTKKLFLIDAMSMIFRAYYALNKNPRITSKGLNTSAIFGFTNILYEIIKKEMPTHLAVAFDSHGPTVRHAEFEQYKAQRDNTPEEIIASIPYIMNILNALGIPILVFPGYEADDIIGTFAKKAEQFDFITFMLTTDKDYGQLVSENIYLYKPERFSKGYSVLGVKEICEQYSIKNPEQLIDLLGIWGDAVDNIPGIKGIGEVGAKKLIGEFGSIENMIANVDKVKNEKLRQKIKEGEENALLSKQLATIILDVPIDFNEQEMAFNHGNREELKKIFTELEFKVLAQKFLNDPTFDKYFTTEKLVQNISSGTLFDNLPLNDESSEKENSSIDLFSKQTDNEFIHFDEQIQNYFIIEEKNEAEKLAMILQKESAFAFKTETSALNSNHLLGIAFSFQPNKAYFVALPEEKTEANDWLQLFSAVFENDNIEKIAHDIKNDIKILKDYNINISQNCFDILLAHYVLEPEMRHQTNSLIKTFLHYEMLDNEEFLTKKNNVFNKSVLAKISCEHADKILQLKPILLHLLEENQSKDLFFNLEMPLVPVLAQMEMEGVCIDIDFLKTYSKILQEKITSIQTDIYRMSGVTFNIASPKQLGEVLFDRMKIINNAKLTKSKQYQTGEEVLQKLVGKHPIINKILEFRSLSKLKSTYVDAFPALVHSSGRVHGQFNQAVTATGRLSSSNPNLQNIPIRTEEGREIRRAFIPKNENYTLLAADYSQIELRLVAALAQDEDMMNAFFNGEDIHASTAARIFSIPIAQVNKDQRRIAKTVNFGILYGMSAFGLSERLQVSRKEAAELIEQYFSKYPKIRQYIDNQIVFAKEHGYVETLMHRRRYLKNINSSNANLRHFEERNAVNAPIQGTAADLIKKAMINIYNELKNQKLQTKIILQVHDELLLDVYLPELEMVKKIVKHYMTTAMNLPIPLTIEMNTGNNWLEAH